MKKRALLLNILLFLIFSCGEEKYVTKPADVWDIDQDGIPRLVTVNFIELVKIARISKFRSAVGHDYSDAFEHCRSMKHYFEPRSDIDWSQIKIYAPVSGRITRVEPEWAGTKVEIESSSYPAFRIVIFHINLSSNLSVGDLITAGVQLGTHIGAQTYADIAVIVNDPTRQGRLVSYFEVISDDVWAEYQQRGLTDRQQLIIPRAVRDAYPLSCSGDAFTSIDPLENWVVLN